MSVAAGGAVVLLAVAVRVVALDWGLPLKYAHIDESVVVFYSLRIAAGVFNPGFYDYPGLFLYLLAAAFRLGAALGNGSFADGIARYAAGDAGAFTLTARALSVAFAGATVALLNQTGRRWGGLSTGVVAGVLLAFNPLHVRHSHYGTVDALTVLLTFWALTRLCSYAAQRTRRGAFDAGALVGLAAAAKYFPGALLAPLLAIPFVKRDRDASVFAALSFAGAAAGFAVGSPPTWLAAPEFMARFGHLAPKMVGGADGAVPFLPTVAGLWRNAGPVALGLGVVGFWTFWRAGGERRWFAGSWGGMLLFLGFWSVQSDHYTLPLYPGLFLMAVEGARWLSRGREKVLWALWAILILVPLPRAARVLRDLSTTDTRLRAGVWARANLPAGASVLRFAHTPEFSPRDPYRVKVDFTNQLLDDALTTDNMKTLQDYEYVIHSEFSAGESPASRRLSRSFSLVHTESGPPSRFPHHPVVRIYRTRVP